MKIYTDLSEVLIHEMYGTEQVIAERFGEEAGQKFWARHLEIDDAVFKELLRGKIAEDEYWAELMKGQIFPFTVEEAKQAFHDNMKIVIPSTLNTYQRVISHPNALGENPGRTSGMPTIYILSDHITECLSEVQEEHPDVFGIVDRCFWSCFMGKIKQDPGFFEDVLDVTGDRTDEVIFVDDNFKNVFAADRSGLTGIQFRTADQLEHDLSSLGFEFAPKVP